MNNNEINQTIHERIMGKCWCEMRIPEWINADNRCKKCTAEYVEPPNYVESIKDAFDVVEKLLQKSGRFLSLKVEYTGKENSSWAQFVQRPNGISGTEFIIDKSLPKAICLAALKTLEEV